MTTIKKMTIQYSNQFHISHQSVLNTCSESDGFVQLNKTIPSRTSGPVVGYLPNGLNKDMGR
jgi:hypothetical protein